MRTLTLLVVATLAIPVLTACDEDDPTGPPTVAEVSGSYEATTLIDHAADGDVDALAEGAFLEIDLDPNGTTSGTFFVPEGDEDGSDLNADLTGTWSLSGDEVTFDHAADTFIRDVVFTYDDGQLVSENQYADVVLTRQ